MFAAVKFVLLQFRTVVVCGFVKIIAPAQDAMFMHDKPDHRRDTSVSEGVRPGSQQSVRVDSAMSVALALSVLCTLRGQDAHLQVQRSSKSGIFGGMLCSSLHPLSLQSTGIHQASTSDEDPQSLVERLQGAFMR